MEQTKDREFKATIPLDTVMPNGRVYPKEGMRKAVDDYLEKHKGKAMLGEFNPDPDSERGPFMHYLHVSHQITKMEVKDSNLFCNVLLLDTPMGKMAKSMLDESDLRFAPRMIGTVEPVLTEDGTQLLNEDGIPVTEINISDLISIDIVGFDGIR